MINCRILCLALFMLCTTGLALGQSQSSLFYFLPQGQYDPNVPTPATFLGYEVGEWHASHDQQLAYMRELARTSKRVQLREYGRTHENRPLICLTISHPDLLARLDEIKAERQRWVNPQEKSTAKPEDMPAVAYMGYSIHGNEASGANAALAVAYWLAAAQGPEVDELLKHAVLLLDPCFNPDGMQRFSSWVNTRRSKSLVPDPTHDEFNETWPSGRTNHYWFDLNRDWLVMQQPESEGRVRIFQEWMPNILTDHHEMGSNSTFFFQPGVPSRVNPITPARNQQLTAQIARYHAEALSAKGIQFFTGENFDDFYTGKGSTYPDANGCIGILFEQGSSRGSAQETPNGLLTFPYSIRNQVITSFSTLKALREMRVELNRYLREFYTSAQNDAQNSNIKGYIMQPKGNDDSGLNELVHRIMQIHRVQCYLAPRDITVDGKLFAAGKAVVVPTQQMQYRLVRNMFERFNQFQDSVFYDISAWTLPDAFGLQWAALDGNALPKDLKPLPARSAVAPVANPDTAAYAYILPADAPNLLSTLVQLHKARYRVKVATLPFEIGGKTFSEGSLVINADRQSGNMMALGKILDSHATLIGNGKSAQGPDLGSSNFVTLSLPKTALITGEGISPLDAGEIWHYLDTRLGTPPVLLDKARLASANLSKYQVLILPDGRYDQVPTEKIKDFVNAGGTLIATGNALKWLKSTGIAPVELRTVPTPTFGDRKQVPYSSRTNLQGARTMPGAIFNASVDPSHPICYGMAQGEMPIFIPEAIYMDPVANVWQNPLLLAQKPLLAGYMHASQQALVSGASALSVHTVGSGRVITFAMNPNFRGFWWGTQRLMGNAVLFGNVIR